MFYKIATGGHVFFSNFVQKQKCSSNKYIISMIVQSLKTIGENSVDLEHTQVLKLGGGHLANKMVDTIFFSQKISP